MPFPPWLMVSSRARERHGLLCMESNCLLGFCQCAAGTLCQIRSTLYFFCQFRCQVETSLKPFCRQRGLVGSKSSCRFTAAAPLYGLLPSLEAEASVACLESLSKATATVPVAQIDNCVRRSHLQQGESVPPLPGRARLAVLMNRSSFP